MALTFTTLAICYTIWTGYIVKQLATVSSIGFSYSRECGVMSLGERIFKTRYKTNVADLQP
jgi:dolichyl-phosphate-mannose--protein O-mannosyl transferase